MNDSKRISCSITLRANPNDRNKIELINYLKSFDRSEANKKVEDILMAALLSLAKQYSGNYTAEQLRLSGLENCNALSHHASYIRQALNIPSQPQLYPERRSRPIEAISEIEDLASTLGNGDREIEVPFRSKQVLPREKEEIEEIEPIPSTLAEDGDVSDISAIFGN